MAFKVGQKVSVTGDVEALEEYGADLAAGRVGVITDGPCPSEHGEYYVVLVLTHISIFTRHLKLGDDPQWRNPPDNDDLRQKKAADRWWKKIAQEKGMLDKE